MNTSTIRNLFKKNDPLADEAECNTFAGPTETPEYMAEKVAQREKELWELELTSNNLECLLALAYENLSDLKTQIAHLKPQENVDELDRYEKSRAIAKRQAEFAAQFAR